MASNRLQKPHNEGHKNLQHEHDGTTMTEDEEELDYMYQQLRQVIDPELGINIVDLGLVYDIGVDGDTAHVRMTLTTPGCPMLDTIVGGVKYVLRDYDDVEVQVVWDPPWHPGMITDEGREQLHFF